MPTPECRPSNRSLVQQMGSLEHVVAGDAVRGRANMQEHPYQSHSGRFHVREECSVHKEEQLVPKAIRVLQHGVT